MGEKCPCGGTLQESEDGQKFCTSCGLIPNSKIDKSPSWSYSSNKDRTYNVDSLTKRIRNALIGSDGTLNIGLNEINRLVKELDLSEEVESVAGIIFRRIISKDSLEGENISVCCYVCIYLATRSVDDENTVLLSDIINVGTVEANERELEGKVEIVKSELQLDLGD